MKYPCYPITASKDAVINIGDRPIKLPRPKWVALAGSRKLECSYFIDAGGHSTVIKLMSETHWAAPVEVWFDRSNWLNQWTFADLEKDPTLPLSLTWGSGGVTKGYNAAEVAATLASLWKVASTITDKMRREILYSACVKGK